MTRTVFSTAMLAIVVGSAGCSTVAYANRPSERAQTNDLITASRLGQMRTESAWQALQTLPGFTSRLNLGARDRYVVYLDHVRIRDVEVLKNIRASDLGEIRIASGAETASEIGGETQILVTTLGAMRARP